MDWSALFATAKPVIGMLHAPALPGSPGNQLSLGAIRDFVLRDAEALAAGGAGGLILENFGDVPFYRNRVPPHTVAYLSVLAHAVRLAFPLPLGINVLRNDGHAALAVAAASGAAFVRVNVYTGARLTDQGILQGEAHELQRYRRMLGAKVLVFADVAVKHSAPIGARNLADEVEDTVERGLADAVIVSGAGTGKRTPMEEVRIAKAATRAPVLVGSGVDADNAAEVLATADGIIAGTALKVDGRTANPVDPARVTAFLQAAGRQYTLGEGFQL